MKNILVLSCGTGEGHNSAAKAIVEELNKRGDNVIMKDTLSFGNKKAEKIVKSFFNNVAVKSPSVFGIMYKAGDIVSNPDFKSPVYYANIIYSTNMYNYIIENKIDIIVCTHLFPMEALTYIKKKYKISIKCYGILTDYTVIPFIEETNMNKYFIPNKCLIEEFESKKVSKNKLLPYGIPVLSKFNTKIDKNTCRINLDIPINYSVILIMTGGIGCGNIVEMIDPLIRKTDTTTLIIVLCGNNNKLIDTIKERYNIDKVRPVSFTNDVNIYMDASDILLSKPGGLSSTEAAVKGIPLIHTMPIPGCETANATFFSKNGMSVNAKSINEIVSSTLKMIGSEQLKNKMLLMQNKKINHNSTIDIVDYILKD